MRLGYVGDGMEMEILGSEREEERGRGRGLGRDKICGL